jgi:hypothetical protein
VVLLPPSADSARSARRAVGDALRLLGHDELVDDASLVVSELVANAVIHARTELDLSVEESGTGVRVAVSDGSPLQPHWTPAAATATSGRGLILVQRLCSNWGVTPHGDDGKTVWAVIEHPSGEDEESSIEDLLAMWTDEPAPSGPPAPELVELVEVALEVEVAAMLASRAHTEDLTRELQLIALGAHRHPVPAPVLRLAHQLTTATEAFYGPRRQMLDQSWKAAQQGRTSTVLRLRLHREDAEAARQWLAAVNEAAALTAQGVLLLPPFPLSMTAFRRSYVTEIITGLTT